MGYNIKFQYMYTKCSDHIRVADLTISLDICHFFVLGVFSSYYFEAFSSFLSAIVTLVCHIEH